MFKEIVQYYIEWYEVTQDVEGIQKMSISFYIIALVGQKTIPGTALSNVCTKFGADLKILRYRNHDN